MIVKLGGYVADRIKASARWKGDGYQYERSPNAQNREKTIEVEHEYNVKVTARQFALNSSIVTSNLARTIRLGSRKMSSVRCECARNYKPHTKHRERSFNPRSAAVASLDGLSATGLALALVIVAMSPKTQVKKASWVEMLVYIVTGLFVTLDLCEGVNAEFLYLLARRSCKASTGDHRQ